MSQSAKPLVQNRKLRYTVALSSVVLTSLGSFGASASAAPAVDIAVPCDTAALIQAITTANGAAGGGTLSLAADCRYTLTSVADAGALSGLPLIRRQITIKGNNATIARAKDAPQFRIIKVDWSGELSLNDATITGGHAPDATGTDSGGTGNRGENGGGIFNYGKLTIVNSVITGNTAGAGAPGVDADRTARGGKGGRGGAAGAVYSYAGGPTPLTITNSVISGNTAGIGGRGGAGGDAGDGGDGGWSGGIYALGTETLALTGSTLSGNSAGEGGTGGQGLDTTTSERHGWGGNGGGGGIGGALTLSASSGGTPQLTIAGSTVLTGNRAGRGGAGGVAGIGPSGDGFGGSGGWGGDGGGIYLFAPLTIDNSTVHDNSAGEGGAGGKGKPYDGYNGRNGSGGGLSNNGGRVTLTNQAAITNNRPDNCYPTTDCGPTRTQIRAVAPNSSDIENKLKLEEAARHHEGLRPAPLR